MFPEQNSLVLEILHFGSQLKMGVFELKEHSPTVKQYNQCSPSFLEVNKFCADLTQALNKADKNGSLDEDGFGKLKKTGQLLWDELLARSIKDRLRATPSANLVLSLDEELVYIPWELLYDGKEFLSLKFNMGRVVRAKEKPHRPQYRSMTDRFRMLVLANPTNDLGSAYQEGLFIKNQFDKRSGKINIDFKSTQIDTVYVKKYLRDYDLVHFAGHCEIDADDPANTGWVLSNGRFTAHDILVMGETSSLPSLIFSNACQSAKVSCDTIDAMYQDEAYSLASAFLFSGVRHYIGSIRKIEDKASLLFAKEFYSQLLKGETVGESMRLGRLKLIRESGEHSVYWAGYLLYGDPDFRLFKRMALPAVSVSGRKAVLGKRTAGIVCLALCTILTGIWLHTVLPTLHPTVYFLSRRSRALFLQGKNRETIDTCLDVIRRDPFFLSAYPQLAGVYERQGKRDEALRYYFEYALMAQKKNDARHMAAAYICIGWLYQQKAQYPKAFEFYTKALRLSREKRDKLNEAAALRKLAVWHMDKEENDRALELLTKSSEINRERKHIYEHRYNLACDYFDLGLVFVNKDDYGTAKKFYTKSLELFRRLNLKSELSDYYFNLGEVYSYEKQYQKALDCYMRGLAIDKRHGCKPGVASDYTMIGELYFEMDDLDKALDFFTQAAALCRQIDAEPELAAVNYDLGLLYKKKNQKNKAREYLRSAQEFYRLIDTPDYQEVKKELLELTPPS